MELSKMALCRLIYRSQTSWDNLSNEVLDELGKLSSKSNTKLGITGLLLLSDETFLQVLEGPEAVVNQLFQKILSDDRHHNIALVEYRQISENNQLFDDWGMNVIDLFDLPELTRQLLRAKYTDNEGFIIVPDEAERALALLLDAKAIGLGAFPGG